MESEDITKENLSALLKSGFSIMIISATLYYTIEELEMILDGE